MAVVPMKKLLICGMKKHRKPILELLQRQGEVEISSVLKEDGTFTKMDVSSAKTVFEKNRAAAEQALQVLERLAPEEKGLLDAFEGRKELSLKEYEENALKQEEVMKTARRLLELEKRAAEEEGAVPKLVQQMDALEPWKDFDLPLDFKGTKQSAAFTGSMPGGTTLEDMYRMMGEYAPQAQTVDISEVSRTKELSCFFVVCSKEEAGAVEDGLRKMNFVRPPLTNLVPSERRKELEREIDQAKKAAEEAREAIKALAGEREAIKFVMDYYAMRAEKYGVLGGLLQSKRVFFITGFVPENRAEALKEALESRFDALMETEEPDEKDDVPVLLHNNKFAEPVESVVESYSLPARGEMDPSGAVALFYYVLFGLMLSDAAYGLIMVAGCLYCLKKLKNIEPGFEKMLKMFLFCGISTTFWGFMFGSFFGDAVNVIAATFFHRPDISLPAIWFEPVDIPMKMLVFAFALGILHLFTGLGIKLYSCIKAGSLKDGIYDAGFWYMLVGGSILYLLTMPMFTDMLGLSFVVPAPVGTVSGVLAAIGAVGIVLTSGRESKNWFKRILKGLYGVYGITSYLSDILSYSRLLALGLATSVISTVFNKMGSMVGDSIPGVIVFILVFLIGHGLNLAINALGAYVHTNRLQFVEFFGKFYEGGGRKFQPFAIHTKYFKVKEDI